MLFATDDETDRTPASPLLTGVGVSLALLKLLKIAAKILLELEEGVVCPLLPDDIVGVGEWFATVTELDLETSGIDVSPRRGMVFIGFEIGGLSCANAGAGWGSKMLESSGGVGSSSRIPCHV